MSKPYITIYTKENGKQELTMEEWDGLGKFDITYHRLDGPAREWRDGTKQWFKEGRRHREDGPAIEDQSAYGAGSYAAWYIEGKSYNKEDYDKLIQEVRDMPLVLRLVDPRRWVREFE